MKKSITAILIGLMISSTAFAQEKCKPVDFGAHFDLFSYTFISRHEKLEKTLKEYCFDKSYATVALNNISDMKTFEMFEQYFDLSRLSYDENQHDLLSFLIISTFNDYEKIMDSKEKEAVHKLYMERNPTDKKAIEDANALTIEKRLEVKKEIIKKVSLDYKDSLTVKKDKFGNYAIYYVIENNKPEYLENAKSYIGNSILLRKNNQGVSPLHALFSASLKNKKTEKMNDEILKTISKEQFLSLKYQGMDFFKFASLLKANNMDLYNKLKTKYPFTDIKVKNQEKLATDIGTSISYSMWINTAKAKGR